MADSHHTSEHALAKGKFPIYRRLTVQETVCTWGAKSRGIGINSVPVNIEPCIVLNGKWLRKAGFTVGQKINVVAEQGKVKITPLQAD
ncbi:type I addiction module toxin, SymE family [Thalassomonas viridans]|uniref:Type I addiction module toxin, SymE family n=1 Tax=Thalassomonas viridans TaxID=137584 RepID=A0AAF0C845_9GAMM|nr:SymE family type I addiction module toxin [Thalassomonas viridans]WDE04348.1 type I addiction module toxin, SymE family [Thalassomonas viridans]